MRRLVAVRECELLMYFKIFIHIHSSVPPQWRRCARRKKGEDKFAFLGKKCFTISFRCSAAPFERTGQAPLRGGAGIQGVHAAVHPLVGVSGVKPPEYLSLSLHLSSSLSLSSPRHGRRGVSCAKRGLIHSQVALCSSI
jgi:hypothetical protein